MTKEDKKKKEKEIEELFVDYYETRDISIRDRLIEEHLHIAEIISKKYANRGIEYDDLYQVASLGLINAVERFDPTKGFKFSSFATPTVTGEIKRYFRDKGWTVRVPRRIQELYKDISNAKTELSNKLGESPRVSDIAEYLNISEENVLEAMDAGYVYSPKSLDDEFDFDEDGDTSLRDFVGVEDHNFEKVELDDLVMRISKNLTETEKKILVDRYFHTKTQISISKELNLSQMSISRMEQQLLKKFRKEMEENMKIEIEEG